MQDDIAEAHFLSYDGGFKPDIMPDKRRAGWQGDGEFGLISKSYRSGWKVTHESRAWVHHRIPASLPNEAVLELAGSYERS